MASTLWRQLRHCIHSAVAFEHFWTLRETPTVDKCQQTDTPASFPHCSHVFRTIHTTRPETAHETPERERV
jgi:hypothetical protein